MDMGDRPCPFDFTSFFIGWGLEVLFVIGVQAPFFFYLFFFLTFLSLPLSFSTKKNPVVARKCPLRIPEQYETF